MDAYIVDAIRTPRGKGTPRGSLHDVRPVELLAGLFQELSTRGVPQEPVADVILGCVTAIGDQGGNIAKIASLYAGWGEHISGATVNRFCCSGLDATNLAAAKVHAGEPLVIGGGVESMSRVPMFSDDGAWYNDPDVVEKTRFVHMGISADLLATLEGITRNEVDEYGARSQQRAAAARDSGRFTRSLVPVQRNGETVLDRDECIRDNATAEDLAKIDAAFVEVGAKGADAIALRQYPHLDTIEHVHHVGVSPAMVDAASLVVVASKAACEQHGLKPRARIRSFANTGTEPVRMLAGNIDASRLAMQRAGVEVRDIDLFEVNESFAAVPIHYERAMQIDGDKLNVNGGAIAMGHPIGATGGILIATLLDELERRDAQLGVVSICGGAGVASATVVERL